MMATTSSDISSLVFKRNISLTRENYALDFDMLRVLGEIEGTRGVAAIAARLDTDITDVKAACVRLLQQQLILPAQPLDRLHFNSNQDSPSTAPETEPGSGIPDPIPDDTQEIQIDERAFSENITDFSLSAMENALNWLDHSPAPSDAITEKPVGPAEETARHGEDPKRPDDKDPRPQPHRPPAAFHPGNGDHAGEETISAWFWNSGDVGPDSRPAALSDTGSKDIFSISRTIWPDGHATRFDAFTSAVGSKQAKKASGMPFTGLWQAGPSVIEETSRPQENIAAIEHFEEGLALLQRSAFKEALRQFETALELDPQNRLCRANIQRIQNMLARDEGS